MKKLICIVGLILLVASMSSCAMIPGAKPAAKTTTTPSPTLIEQVRTLQSQQSTYLIQVNTLSSKVATDEADIATLKNQLAQLLSDENAAVTTTPTTTP